MGEELSVTCPLPSDQLGPAPRAVPSLISMSRRPRACPTGKEAGSRERKLSDRAIRQLLVEAFDPLLSRTTTRP